METKVVSSTTKGLVLALILIVLSVVINITDSETTVWGRWLGIIILMGGVIWACISFGKQNNNQVTFGNVFAHGFKTCAVATSLVILFTIIFLLIFPNIKEKAMDNALQEMQKNPNMTQSQIDQAMALPTGCFM